MEEKRRFWTRKIERPNLFRITSLCCVGPPTAVCDISDPNDTGGCTTSYMRKKYS